MPDFRGQVIDARFRVEDSIGQGGMGEVWKVQHIHTLQHLALKTLRTSNVPNEGTLARFLHEARLAAAIHSCNVVQIVDVRPDYVHDGLPLPFIVMELAEGPSLAEVLTKRGKIRPSELLWLVQQVTLGLSSAHQLGIVHRDLKPSNILIAREFDGSLAAKLCDFGIAKIQTIEEEAGDGAQSFSTDKGTFVGTPRYMAPEQLLRCGRTVPATDQWALALICFRCLTGHDYFDSARNGAELVLDIVYESLLAPSALMAQLPQSFDSWFLKSCDRDPHARFADVEAQLRGLQAAFANSVPEPVRLGLSMTPSATSFDSDTTRPIGSFPPVARTQIAAARWKAIYLPLVAASTAFAIVGTNWQAKRVSCQAVAGRVTEPVIAQSSHDRPASTAGVAVPPLISLDANASAEVELSPSLVATRIEVKSTNATAAPIPTNAKGRIRKAPVLRWVKALPLGAPCTRSAQCREGICLAEICQ